MRNYIIITLYYLSLFAFNAVADEKAVSGTQPLITEDGVQNWTIKNNTVPVCWETAGYDREKKIAQNAVTTTWQYWANINFTGWDSCPTSGNEEHVRIRISPQGVPPVEFVKGLYDYYRNLAGFSKEMR